MEATSHTAALQRHTTHYVYIRHPRQELWCGHSNQWTPERREALTFNSNIDALTYCSAMNVPGVLVAYEASGALLYELEIGALVHSFTAF